MGYRSGVPFFLSTASPGNRSPVAVVLITIESSNSLSNFAARRRIHLTQIVPTINERLSKEGKPLLESCERATKVLESLACVEDLEIARL